MAAEQGDSAGDGVANPGMGLDLLPPQHRTIWVRITAQASFAEPVYSFEQVVHMDNEAVTVEGGITCSDDALETNNNTAVPIGTVVPAWPSESSAGEAWRFFYPGAGSNPGSTYTEETWTVDQNPYEPPEGYDTIRVSTSGPEISLISMVLLDNQTVTIINVGDWPILIPHDSPLGDPTETFQLPTTGVLVLDPQGVATFHHDPVTDTTILTTTTEPVRPPTQEVTTDTDLVTFELQPGMETVIVTVDGVANVNLTTMATGYPSQTITIVNSDESDGTLTIVNGSSDPGVPFGNPNNADFVIQPGSTVVVTMDGEVGTGTFVITDPGPAKTTVQTETISVDTDNLPLLIGTTTLVLTVTDDVQLTSIVPAFPGQTVTVVIDPASTGTLTLTDNEPGVDNPFAIDGFDWPMRPATTVVITSDPDGTWFVTQAPDRTVSMTISGPTTVDDLVLPPFTTVVVVEAVDGPVTLTGLAAADYLATTVVIVSDPASTETLTIADNDPGSTVTFTTTTGADLDLNPGDSITVTVVVTDADTAPVTTASPGVILNAVGASGLAWSSVTKTYSDFSDTDTVKDIEVLSLGARQVLHFAVIKHSQAFSGGTIAGYNISVGTGSSPFNNILSGLDVFVAPGNTVLQHTGGTAFLYNFGAATSVRAEATSMGGNLNTATQGSVTFHFLVSTIP